MTELGAKTSQIKEERKKSQIVRTKILKGSNIFKSECKLKLSLVAQEIEIRGLYQIKTTF